MKRLQIKALKVILMLIVHQAIGQDAPAIRKNGVITGRGQEVLYSQSVGTVMKYIALMPASGGFNNCTGEIKDELLQDLDGIFPVVEFPKILRFAGNKTESRFIQFLLTGLALFVGVGAAVVGGTATAIALEDKKEIAEDRVEINKLMDDVEKSRNGLDTVSRIVDDQVLINSEVQVYLNSVVREKINELQCEAQKDGTRLEMIKYWLRIASRWGNQLQEPYVPHGSQAEETELLGNDGFRNLLNEKWGIDADEIARGMIKLRFAVVEISGAVMSVLIFINRLNEETGVFGYKAYSLPLINDLGEKLQIRVPAILFSYNGLWFEAEEECKDNGLVFICDGKTLGNPYDINCLESCDFRTTNLGASFSGDGYGGVWANCDYSGCICDGKKMEGFQHFPDKSCNILLVGSNTRIRLRIPGEVKTVPIQLPNWGIDMIPKINLNRDVSELNDDLKRIVGSFSTHTKLITGSGGLSGLVIWVIVLTVISGLTTIFLILKTQRVL